MADFYEEVTKITSAVRSAAVATIVGAKGSTPRETGAKMLIRDDGTIWGSIGGECLEGKVWEEAMNIIREEKLGTLHFDLTGKEAAEIGRVCGGFMDIYIEPIASSPLAFIFGGGHISQFVARMSAMVGFHVVVLGRPAAIRQ